jgi:xylose dehydrogenase (NAD/NADP)
VTDAGPVRWGFLGAGFIASRALAPAVHRADGAVLQVVGARDVERAAALEPVRTASSYAEVCASDDVDAVYIALANDDHMPWALEALAAGKHVLCEKPLGLDAAQAAALARAAQDSGQLLVEATWSRWHPRTRRFEQLMAAVDGGPREVRTWFTFRGVPEGNYRLDPARGGGALLDVGCYAVSAALSALGADAVEVAEVDRQVGPTGVDLTTTAVLSHAHGTATVTGSFDRPESQGITVQAPGLSVEFVGQAFTTWQEPCALRIIEDGVERQEQFAACDPYRLMVEAMSARIGGADAWLLPLADSVAVAATLDAIAASPATAPA